MAAILALPMPGGCARDDSARRTPTPLAPGDSHPAVNGSLIRGTGRAEALRQAKLHLLHQSRYAHPYYGTALIPAGDWRPLDKNTMGR
jgi:hypothetical protein